jgi:hypothetical protein
MFRRMFRRLFGCGGSCCMVLFMVAMTLCCLGFPVESLAGGCNANVNAAVGVQYLSAQPVYLAPVAQLVAQQQYVYQQPLVQQQVVYQQPVVQQQVQYQQQVQQVQQVQYQYAQPVVQAQVVYQRANVVAAVRAHHANVVAVRQPIIRRPLFNRRQNVVAANVVVAGY